MRSSFRVRLDGDFSKTQRYLKRIKEISTFENTHILEKYGKRGCDALSDATPIDTGLTASSWYYKILKDDKNHTVSLSFHNSNISEGTCNVAIILQYGHGTKNGGYVEGIDYINPALKPIFDDIANEAWNEVISV